jgi:anoctamin-7
LKKFEGKQEAIGINFLLLAGVYESFTPLHDGPCLVHVRKVNHEELKRENLRAWLYHNWCKTTPGKFLTAQQPIREIRKYFGEEVAYYFAWLGFYTLWLIPLSICGLVVVLYGFITTWPNPTLSTVFDNDLTGILEYIFSV